MDLLLHGKVALVSGSSAGIGESIAKFLANEGVKVVIHGRRLEELERVAGSIRQKGGAVAIARGDLARDEGAQEVVDQALQAFGEINILVNNAGGFPEQSWEKSTSQDWLDLYNQNVVSMLRLIQHLAPLMRQSGWGRIIQIASAAGMQASAGMPSYSATKAAIINMTVSLAKELANTNITVNTVSPGPILTPGMAQFLKQEAKHRGWDNEWRKIEKKAAEELFPNPTGRIGQPEEVGAVVAFLASPLASFINGANIRVDGGIVKSVN